MFTKVRKSVKSFTSKLPKQTSSLAPDYVWSNVDQDPIPVERRTWTGLTFVIYWFSDRVTYSTWANGASVVALGLSPSDAIWIVFAAALCNAIPTVMNGAIGADLHIPFPIAIRASYGYWLSCFCVISRGILALFWFGVQSAGGATAITQMITAIFPSYDHLHNSLPASAGITSKGLLSYFIYHVVQTSFLFIRTEKLRWTGIMLTDYWFVKKSKIDVPALYDPEGIYGKCNWCSILIMVLVIVPMLPALANKVAPDNVHVPKELSNLFTINWLYGFVASCVLYYAFNVAFPQRRTLIPAVAHGDTVYEGTSLGQQSIGGNDSCAEKFIETLEPVELGLEEKVKSTY